MTDNREPNKKKKNKKKDKKKKDKKEKKKKDKIEKKKPTKKEKEKKKKKKKKSKKNKKTGNQETDKRNKFSHFIHYIFWRIIIHNIYPIVHSFYTLCILNDNHSEYLSHCAVILYTVFFEWYSFIIFLRFVCIFWMPFIQETETYRDWECRRQWSGTTKEASKEKEESIWDRQSGPAYFLHPILGCIHPIFSLIFQF